MMSARTIPEITTREYAGFQRVIADASGITLGPGKRQLLMGRVARCLRERGLSTYGAYLETVRADRSGQELVRLLDLVATNETSFFREGAHFRYLAESLCPAWRAQATAGVRSRHVRVWSAACSTGQEPYSVAMMLHDQLPASAGWTLEIIASDISTRALDVAEQGVYDVARVHGIPAPYLRRYMTRDHASSPALRVTQALRGSIRFLRVNLNEDHYAVQGSFDLVFCSNALIYFSRVGQAAVIARLTERVALDGRLFVGHAESLHHHRSTLRSVAPTVYARTDHPIFRQDLLK